MTKTESVKRFWQECCAVRPELDPTMEFDVWCFGDGREMADGLAELVLQGKKRATAALLWDADGDETPIKPGQISIVTDYDGEPKCVIRFTEVRVVPFNKVDENFAFDEGEGDQSLDYWRAGHWNFFSRYCSTIGREPCLEMPIVCKRFELVYPELR